MCLIISSLRHLHLVHPSPSVTHRCLSSSEPEECRKSMASLVSRGTMTLLARSTPPDVWITWHKPTRYNQWKKNIKKPRDKTTRVIVTCTSLRGLKRKWSRSTALGFWMCCFNFPCNKQTSSFYFQRSSPDTQHKHNEMFHTWCFMRSWAFPHQQIEGVFELLKTVDKLILRWRFRSQC